MNEDSRILRNRMLCSEILALLDKRIKRVVVKPSTILLSQVSYGDNISGAEGDEDELVAVDSAATAGYLGATDGAGVLRCDSSLTKTDGGDFITIGTTTYALISANDGNTDINGTELETLSDGSNADALHTHAGLGPDEKVKVDAAATADYIGAASNDGVLRTGTGLSYTDNGDSVTLAVDADYTDISNNDGATNVTGAELETLSDGSNADALHVHAYGGLPRTDVITYTNVLGISTDHILNMRLFQTEILNAFDGEPDVPRNYSVTVSAGHGGCTGTVVITGYDADGASQNQTINVNVAADDVDTYYSDRAWGNNIQIQTTLSAGGGFYTVGISGKLGLPNYPFNAAGDVFKMNQNGVDAPVPAVDATYGTVDVTFIAGDDLIFWFRPYK